jgi:rsbT antagonist protein RsbS
MTDDTSQPLPLVTILRQGHYLIASIHTALDDGQLTRFQHDLVEQIGRERSHGVIIDLAAMDVLDSFATRTLRNLARMASLRGASTVMVGIHPAVALAMARLGMHQDLALTAFDLDDGIAMLDDLTV